MQAKMQKKEKNTFMLILRVNRIDYYRTMCSKVYNKAYMIFSLVAIIIDNTQFFI